MDILFRFWNWWHAELSEMFFAVFKFREPNNRIIRMSFLDEAGIFVPNLEEFPSEKIEATKAGVKAYLDKVGYDSRVDVIELVLNSEDIFISEAKYPILAQRKLSRFLSIDIQENFPFNENDIYSSSKIVNEDNGEEQFEAIHGFVKRSTIDPLINRMNHLDIRLNAIRFPKSDGRFDFLPSTYGQEERKKATQQSIAIVVLLLISFCILFFTYEARQKTTLKELKAQISSQKNESSEVRKITEATNIAVQQVNALRMMKAQSPMVVEIWDDVSRLLPPDSEITQLNYTKGTIRLAGYSNSAGNLIPILEADPKISNVTFSAPVTRDRRRKTEKYVISMSYTVPLERPRLQNEGGTR